MHPSPCSPLMLGKEDPLIQSNLIVKTDEVGKQNPWESGDRCGRGGEKDKSAWWGIQNKYFCFKQKCFSYNCRVPWADTIIKMLVCYEKWQCWSLPDLSCLLRLFTWFLLSFQSVPSQNTANPTLVESLGRLVSWWSLCLATCWIYSINPFIFDSFSETLSSTAVWSPAAEET